MGAEAGGRVDRVLVLDIVTEDETQRSLDEGGVFSTTEASGQVFLTSALVEERKILSNFSY